MGKTGTLMWAFIALFVLAALIAGICYLVYKISLLDFVIALSKGKRIYRLIISILTAAVIYLILHFSFGFFNSVIIMIHLTAIYALVSLFARLMGKSQNRYAVLIIAVSFTFIYLLNGYSNFRNVRKTAYSLETVKNTGGHIRIAQITDAHIGAAFTAGTLREHLKEIEACEPDILVITGDLADDGTGFDDFCECCKAFNDFKARYGVYYVFGNHDKGMGRSRGCGREDIIRELTQNNVHVLEDECELINNSFYLIGRRDRSDRDRKQLENIMQELDPAKYTVILDHQPNSYDEEAACEADLVLSGHTHGGQFFPIQKAGEWLHANDFTYGHEKRNNTDFIVSSGISDWEIIFKTGCFSEYVIIDID